MAVKGLGSLLMTMARLVSRYWVPVTILSLLISSAKLFLVALSVGLSLGPSLSRFSKNANSRKFVSFHHCLVDVGYVSYMHATL